MLELLLLISVIALFLWHRKLSDQVRSLESTVQSLRQQIEAGATVPLPETGTAEAEAAAEAGVPQGEDVPAVQEAARDMVSDPEPMVSEGAPASQPKPRESFESRFGARWSVWVGGLALALGGIFLVRYSIDAGLLGPAARLVLATLFGLLLAGAGEVLRRGALPRLPKAYTGAMIPGVLTAAASITLIATTYTAYGVYGFIGATPAFLLLALISLATLALSLLHGQALAGLGLAASLITPALVASDAPKITFLFGFLSLVWLAAAGAARIRRWHVLPVLANLGLALWVIAYALGADVLDPVPPGAALLVLIAGTGFLWPGLAFETGGEEAPSDPWRRLRALLGRRPRTILCSASLSAFFAILCLTVIDTPSTTHPALMLTAVAGALAGLGAGRRAGAIPALFAALTAVLGTLLIAVTQMAIATPPATAVGSGLLGGIGPSILGALTLGAIITLCSLVFQHRKGMDDPDLGALWALLASAVPISLATITFLNEGTLGRDWLHGIYGLAIGAALLATVERLWRRDRIAPLAADLLLLGAFAAFTFTLHALTHGLVTTLGVAALGFAFVLTTRLRPLRGLPWAMVLAAIVIGARIAWEPTVVGPDALGKTPVFNALLAGYGVPAALLIASAFLLRDWPGRRLVNALQGLAALAGLLAVSILVRHAMNGGVLDELVPTLGEQSTYTLLLIGLSGILMTLDTKAPSLTFRVLSMLAGVIATLNILSAHLFVLNPFFSNEGIGTWPVVNLLLPGYLLPALGYAGLALYARDRRPKAYVMMLSLTGAVLAFLWATLSVRWFWQGPNIGDWKGFLPAETYTYSVVWLLIGVGLLALGSRLDARSLRLASAGLVLISVCKVFLIDMSNLEGILRALSFMGLGGVLIGIGLFYQRILARSHEAAPPAGD
ncbi:DUF2339 domain-containing protein [Affinirhizobium pseudoryzae]|uniref:DUF2339 domain-containing protein n=1 Tax=Allorhizobium pseudoryzae TaxID=379684 RepID=UPI0013EC6099|nr:DUF2339 domain-containing protein [Allorhizobium pseudoryzae]